MPLMRDVQGTAAEKLVMFEKVRAGGGLANEHPSDLAEAEKMLREFAATERESEAGNPSAWYSGRARGADGTLAELTSCVEWLAPRVGVIWPEAGCGTPKKLGKRRKWQCAGRACARAPIWVTRQ